MKKTFASLAALALSLAVASAQKVDSALAGSPVMGHGTLSSAAMAKSPQRKIGLDGDERLIGFYATDDLPDLKYGGYLNIPYNGTWRVGALFENGVTEKVVGGEITKFRFALGFAIPVSCAFVYLVDGDHNISREPIVEIDMSGTATQSGWNDVTLDVPITIEDGMGYMVGYEYVQEKGDYPIVTDMELDPDNVSDYGYMGYGTIGGSTAWHRFENQGNLCVQAVVRGGGIVDRDIVLDRLSVRKFSSQDDGLDYSFRIRSDGREIPRSYTLDVSVDGNDAVTLDTPVPLTTSYQTLSGWLDLSGMQDGQHALRISVGDIDGALPVEATDDDVLEAAFYVYDGLVDRQMNLIETFTSVACSFCPGGDDLVKKMQEDRPGEYAWAVMHFDMGGYSDPYYVPDADYVKDFLGNDAYPQAAFNRYVMTDSDLGLSGQVLVSIGSYNTSLGASCLEAAMDRYNEDNPAFVSVDIATDYDEATRELAIKVTGDGARSAREFLGDCRLSVYLTEDGLVSSQYYFGSWMGSYEHDATLRKVATSYAWGDGINWTSDSGYENDIIVKLDESWNHENMGVIAFISGPMAVGGDGNWSWSDLESAMVNNANMVHLAGPSGIATVTNGGRVTETSRITMDGRRVTGPVRGVNIVRMSDGSTRKVIVR